VVLLEEEMRRVLVSLEYEANVWEKRGPTRQMDNITRGQRAYGHRQADIRRRMAQKFVKLWENLDDDVAPTTELVPAPTELEIEVEEETEIVQRCKYTTASGAGTAVGKVKDVRLDFLHEADVCGDGLHLDYPENNVVEFKGSRIDKAVALTTFSSMLYLSPGVA